MSTISPMLQKTLVDLETKLTDVYSRPLDPIPFDDIKRRFDFLRKLVALEIESQPEPSGKLEEMSQKVDQLEAHFDNWNESKSCIFDNPKDTSEICGEFPPAIIQREKMSTSSPMVQKKLVDLETKLTDVYSRPLDPTAEDHMLFDDIKRQFDFLRKLVAKEIESHPEPSGELKEIRQKVDQLEVDFDKWNESKSCIFDNPKDRLCDYCSQAIIVLHQDDSAGSESEVEKEFSEQQTPVKLMKMEERGRGERKMRRRGKYWKGGVGLLKRERKKKKKGKKDWEAFCWGMIVGGVIIWLMMKFFPCIEDEAAFLLPPTPT